MATKMYEPLREASRMPDIHALAAKVERLFTDKLFELSAARRRVQTSPSDLGKSPSPSDEQVLHE